MHIITDNIEYVCQLGVHGWFLEDNGTAKILWYWNGLV